MSSVGKRRRERIRAKRAARQQAAQVGEQQATAEKDQPKTPFKGDGHVAAAPGRGARKIRRTARRRSRSQAESSQQTNSAPRRLKFWRMGSVSIRRRSLRQRRDDRRRERDRRERADQPETRVRPRGVVWISWRWLSGIITIFLLIILYIMVATPVFVVDSIVVGAVGEKQYLTPEEVFEVSKIANYNLFWLDVEDIEAELERNPSIADAQVFIDWPPNMVSIIITEREPSLIWDQGDFRVWVDVNGIVMFRREEREDLLRIVYPGENLEPLGVGSVIDRDIVVGALQLREKLPTINVMLYDPVRGLGFREDGNWIAWFGIGTNMDQKLLVYEAIVRTYYPVIRFAEVDVSDPDHPSFVRRFSE